MQTDSSLSQFVTTVDYGLSVYVEEEVKIGNFIRSIEQEKLFP